MYELLKRDGLAKRGRFTTVHGVVETPVFMNVGTAAAIKGAVSTDCLLYTSIPELMPMPRGWQCLMRDTTDWNICLWRI